MDGDALLAEIPRLRRYARALLDDRAAADDLVQDTLERAWAKARQWRTGTGLRPWLFGIMHNLRVDQLRRSPVSAQSIDAADLDLPARATQSDGLDLRDLDAAMNLLGEEQREVLLLVALEEMSYAEIAGTLGIPQGTVMSRLSRGRENLRRILAGEPATTRLRVVK